MFSIKLLEFNSLKGWQGRKFSLPPFILFCEDTQIILGQLECARALMPSYDGYHTNHSGMFILSYVHYDKTKLI